MSAPDLYRGLPKVDRLVCEPALAVFRHEVAVGAARQVLDELRAAIAGGLSTLPDVVSLVVARANVLARGRLRPVINATGVVVHTNLGRAPWSEDACAAALAASGYCDLEITLQTGERGGRLSGLGWQMRHLCGAEASIVVNNGAAAVLLALTALAKDQDVVISRGELVEIGGSFRVPDVIASGGARLVEVGTTNRTHLADFERVLGSAPALVLRVHPSNFKVIGFTATPDRSELCALAHSHGVPVLEDLGSGCLESGGDEPSVREVLASGVDLVCFSGDKLLGGPQAGIIAGKADLVAQCRRHPLYRALRLDKVRLAALEATLGEWARGERPPVGAMLHASAEVLQARAVALATALVALGAQATVVATQGLAGGGALPGQVLPSFGVQVVAARAHDASARLRVGQPAVLARVEADGLLLDVRTVAAREVEGLARAVADVVREGHGQP